MRTITYTILAVAFTAAVALAGYEYEGKWGSYGTGDGQFDTPQGFYRAPNGDIYVADSGNDRVQYFTAYGSFKGKWGRLGRGDGEFNSPYDIGINSSHVVYVIDQGNERVQYFTAAGSFLGKWGTSGSAQGEFDAPCGITTAPNGNVYVADTFNYRIQYFTPAGSFLGMWGSRGSGDGQFDRAHQLAVATDGKVYVADWSNERIQYFTSAGSFLGKFPIPEEAQCFGIDVTPNYYVYVTIARGYIGVFSATGSLLDSFGESGTGNGQFRFPRGITVDPGNLRAYVGDNVLNRIQYFRCTNFGITPTSLGKVKALFQ